MKPPCARCGYNFADHFNGVCPGPAVNSRAKQWRILLTAGALVVGTLTVALLIHQDTPEEREQHMKQHAISKAESACFEVVSRQYRMPAFAHWKVSEKDGVYSVSSYLEDPFTIFTCTVTNPTDTPGVSVEYVEMK